MVFTICDYCSKKNDKLSALLRSCCEDELFLGDTKIMLDYREGELWCTFFMNYTFSCNDMRVLNDKLAEYWWCVSPCFEEGEYRLAVCLKGVVV